MARITIRKSKAKKGSWVVVVNKRPVKRYGSKRVAMKAAARLKKKLRKKKK